MSIMAPVGEDGKLQTHTTSGDSLTQKAKNKNTVDSDTPGSRDAEPGSPGADQQYRVGITVCDVHTGSEDERDGRVC